jgi:hypothetical protein
MILMQNRPVIDWQQIVTKKISDFWILGTGMKRLDEINENLNLNISLVTYMRLGEVLNRRCRKLTANPPPNPLLPYFLGSNKGSKNLRRILYNADKTKKRFKISTQRNVTTFFRLIEIPVPAEHLLK